jgi:hypothetical protein
VNAILKYQRYILPALAAIGVWLQPARGWERFEYLPNALANLFSGLDLSTVLSIFLLFLSFVATGYLLTAAALYSAGKAPRLLSNATLVFMLLPLAQLVLYTIVDQYAIGRWGAFLTEVRQLTYYIPNFDWDYSYFGWALLALVLVFSNQKHLAQIHFVGNLWRAVFVLFLARWVAMLAVNFYALEAGIANGYFDFLSWLPLLTLPLWIFAGVSTFLGYRAAAANPRVAGRWAKWILAIIAVKTVIAVVSEITFRSSYGYSMPEVPGYVLSRVLREALASPFSDDMVLQVFWFVTVTLPPIAGLVWIAIKAKSFPEVVKAAPVVYATAPVQPQAAPVSYTVKPVGFDTETGRPILRYDEETGKPIYLD